VDAEISAMTDESLYLRYLTEKGVHERYGVDIEASAPRATRRTRKNSSRGLTMNLTPSKRRGSPAIFLLSRTSCDFAGRKESRLVLAVGRFAVARLRMPSALPTSSLSDLASRLSDSFIWSALLSQTSIWIFAKLDEARSYRVPPADLRGRFCRSNYHFHSAQRQGNRS
jgi:hypothetical protein